MHEVRNESQVRLASIPITPTVADTFTATFTVTFTLTFATVHKSKGTSHSKFRVLYLRLVPMELNQMQIPISVYMNISTLFCLGPDLRCYRNPAYRNATEKHCVNIMFVQTANIMYFFNNYFMLMQVRIDHQFCAEHSRYVYR